MIPRDAITDRLGSTDENRAGRPVDGGGRPGWKMNGGTSRGGVEAAAKRREAQAYGQGERQETRNSDFPLK